jgi:hypothetical protein
VPFANASLIGSVPPLGQILAGSLEINFRDFENRAGYCCGKSSAIIVATLA